MRLPIFQLDAFTDRLFGGNPAAVVIVPERRPKSSPPGRTKAVSE